MQEHLLGHLGLWLLRRKLEEKAKQQRLEDRQEVRRDPIRWL